MFSPPFTQQKPTKSVSFFDDSAPFVKTFLYVLLGVLAGLLLIGTVCDIGIKGKAKIKDDVELGECKLLFYFFLPNDTLPSLHATEGLIEANPSQSLFVESLKAGIRMRSTKDKKHFRPFDATYLHTRLGPVVRKQINANPRLQVDRGFQHAR